jgi:hypothetical protein
MHRVFCGHQDWVEGLLVCAPSQNSYDQAFTSFSADGHVCCWELDAEQNCDVFRLVVSGQRCSVGVTACQLHWCCREALGTYCLGAVTSAVCFNSIALS